MVEQHRVVARSHDQTAADEGQYTQTEQLRTTTIFKPPNVLVVSPRHHHLRCAGMAFIFVFCLEDAPPPFSLG